MTTRFYAVWAVAVILAVLLPVAVPYVVWSGDDESPCASRARNAIANGGFFGSRGLPLSVDVQECITIDEDVTFRAEITVRGPYGLPIGEYRVTQQDVDSVNGRNAVLAVVALITGVVVVSIPFVTVLVREALARQMSAPR